MAAKPLFQWALAEPIQWQGWVWYKGHSQGHTGVWRTEETEIRALGRAAHAGRCRGTRATHSVDVMAEPRWPAESHKPTHYTDRGTEACRGALAHGTGKQVDLPLTPLKSKVCQGSSAMPPPRQPRGGVRRRMEGSNPPRTPWGRQGLGCRAQEEAGDSKHTSYLLLMCFRGSLHCADEHLPCSATPFYFHYIFRCHCCPILQMRRLRFRGGQSRYVDRRNLRFQWGLLAVVGSKGSSEE